ncbi:unnamed protein product [Cyclocybe aegerita]|uniref:SH3 domain-containing protein n=1 Tax=Cyclocybe aegerita TaxID=1973307 RepID=A0A8S0W8L2_CYCAE|nr:unnamed protein product [Cyclocybe aegerita]
MSPQDPQATALLTHVLSQIEANVQFLAEQGYITAGDASAILTKLPNPGHTAPAPSGISAITSRMSNLMGGGNNASAPRAVPPTPMPAAPAVQQCRAMWAYSGEDTNDLPFAAGDIIEIVDETNPDWWTGRVHGKQGIFPSAYVERITPQQQEGPKKPYKPFGAAYHGMAAPPPPGQGTNAVGLQEKEGTEEKKNKFGKYKDTLAHSAVGGVGFGAGSAIGGGLVRAIF